MQSWFVYVLFLRKLFLVFQAVRWDISESFPEQYHCTLLCCEPCSTSLPPTPLSWTPDFKPSPVNTGTLLWLLLISFQIRWRSTVLWGEVLSDSWNGREAQPAPQSFEPGYELRQHQTRIKSTNLIDPGWPGRLLTTLWRGVFSLLGRRHRGGKRSKGQESGANEWMKGATLEETACQKGSGSSYPQRDSC